MKVLILMYHRIGETAVREQYTVSRKNFLEQMQLLGKRGYPVLPLQRIVEGFRGGGPLPDRAVVITFDDGFQETYEHALPVLKQLKFHATFFLVTKLVGRTNAWMESRSMPCLRLMDWAQVKQLSADGFEVGSHTSTHPVLTAIDVQEAAEEIRTSKEELENRVAAPVRFFAYPHGQFNSSVRNLVENTGYAAACCTMSGFNNESADYFALRRVEIVGTDSLRTFSWKLQFGANEIGCLDVIRYYGRRVATRLPNL
jgi:peptidoglycan/xylan/chitin deacetylase (PgdA/CDA1 family)